MLREKCFIQCIYTLLVGKSVKHGPGLKLQKLMVYLFVVSEAAIRHLTDYVRSV